MDNDLSSGRVEYWENSPEDKKVKISERKTRTPKNALSLDYMEFEDLKKELANSFNAEIGKTKSVGVSLPDSQAIWYELFADRMAKRGINRAQLLLAIIEMCEDFGFEPDTDVHSKTIFVRAHKALLDRLDELSTQHSLKRADLLRQYMSYFRQNFHGDTVEANSTPIISADN